MKQPIVLGFFFLWGWAWPNATYLIVATKWSDSRSFTFKENHMKDLYKMHALNFFFNIHSIVRHKCPQDTLQCLYDTSLVFSSFKRFSDEVENFTLSSVNSSLVAFLLTVDNFYTWGDELWLKSKPLKTQWISDWYFLTIYQRQSQNLQCKKKTSKTV